MARQRALRVGALNIKTEPEDPGTYASLVRRAYKTESAAPFWGNKFGVIGSLAEEKLEDGQISSAARSMCSRKST